MAISIGKNLTVASKPAFRQLSKALNKFQLALVRHLGKTVYGDTPAAKVFTKAGAPATDTEADSPGSDLCFIIDTTNSDVYLISGWSAVGTFTSTKVVD